MGVKMRFLCVGVLMCLAAAAYARPQEAEVNPAEAQDVALKQDASPVMLELDEQELSEAREMTMDKNKKKSDDDKKKEGARKDNKKKKDDKKKNDNKRNNKNKNNKKNNNNQRRNKNNKKNNNKKKQN